MIITPKNAIEMVIEQKAKDKPTQYYNTKLQKYLFWSTNTSFCLCILLGVLTYIFKNKELMLLALMMISVSIILLLFYQISITVPEILRMRNPEKEISTELTKSFNNDLDLIYKLADTFEANHLRYAKNSYCQISRHLHERIGVLVGAIEKVGVIPLAVTAYLSYSKYKTDPILSFSGLEWLSISFLFLYLFAIRMKISAQWMEHISEIFTEALKTKEINDNKTINTATFHSARMR